MNLVCDYCATSGQFTAREFFLAGVPASLLLLAVLLVIVLAIGYPVGGALGDRLFKRTPADPAYEGIAW